MTTQTIKNYENVCINLTPRLAANLKEITKSAEKESTLHIGESFVMRCALEDFLTKSNQSKLIINKRIRFLQQRADV